MSTTLYEEAIADAKKLKEMAEQNAKNQIIDAITPKIRQLVEKQLIGEMDDAEEISDDALDIVLPPSDDEEEDVTVLDLDTLVTDVEAEVGETTVSVAPGADADIQIGGDGGVDIETDGIEVHVGGEETEEIEFGDDELLLSKESVQALVNIIHGTDIRKKVDESFRQTNRLRSKTERLDKILKVLENKTLNPLQQTHVCNHYRNLLQETVTLRDEVILTEGEEGSNELCNQIDQLIKEIRKMSQRRNQILKRLLEAEEENGKKEELDELDAILTLEPADEEEADEVEDLLADLEIDVNLEEPVETVEVGAEEEVEVEVGEEEIPEVEMEETYEIDEAMLRRELRRMRRLREQEESDAVDASPAHGGLDGEVVEIDDEDLLNALADELGDPSVPEPTVEGKNRRRQRAVRRREMKNESRNTRALQHKLVEYKKAVVSLRNQLIEMNLFNAKLLYANKLMQNRNVTSKQQRAIVEALDNAKTLREAKLLYKSLTASLGKRTNKTLSEGRVAKTLGSSSRSTRSAAPANNGNELDRWAVLAGINKDN